MKSLYLTLLSALLICSASAGMIGPVEYCLPLEIAGDWCIENKLECRESRKIVYMPNVAPNGEKYFEACVYKKVMNLDDIPAFKASVGAEYSDMDVTVNILDKAGDSLLYEWIAKDNGQARIHGWGRAFSFPDETVILSYQTDDLSHLEGDRAQWIPVLKDAKVIENKH